MTSRSNAGSGFSDRVMGVVERIPSGLVATYGQVAALAGHPAAARQVGWVLGRGAGDRPWHRVVNRAGRISLREGAEEQRFRLESEGVMFVDGVIDLERFGWHEERP